MRVPRAHVYDVFLVAALICALPAATAPAADSVRAVVSVEPVGLLLLGPTLEAEVAAGERAGIVAGVQQMDLGLLANAMSDEEGYPLHRATLYVAGLRFYRDTGTRLTGFYAGPRFEIGPVSAGDRYNAYAAFLMADLGYRRMLGARWCGAASLQGGIAAAWEGREIAYSYYYPIGQAGLSLGYAF